MIVLGLDKVYSFKKTDKFYCKIMATDYIVDPSEIDWAGDFDTQVNNVLQAVRLTRQQVDDLRRLFIDLERSLQLIWQGCKVMPFGSIVTGLGITSSDVDVYVYVPEGYNCNQVQSVKAARKVLGRRPMIYHQPFAITTAKVPIVKFYHIPTRRNCDVNFKSPSGVRNSELIAYLLHADSRALPFTILVKYWSKVHKLTGTNLIPNYALTMLAIFYLQQKNILPAIVKLQSPNNSFYVDDWNTAYNQKYIHKTDNEQSLYELLGDCFKFYSSFNFDENIVSPFMGGPVHRDLFKNTEDIPQEFDLYKRNVRNKICIDLKIDTKMCVQDPFEHNRNCTVAVFPRLAERLLLHFKLAAQIYEENKSADFLKDILTKKPFIPQGPKKMRKNKDNFKNKVASNTVESKIEESKDESKTQVSDNSQVSEEVATLDDKASIPKNTTFVENIQISNDVPTENRPIKRTLHNNLTDLYRRTKRRKK